MTKPTDLVTVVTCTVGDSAGRLECLCDELRRFTDAGFKQVISDDGTTCGHMVNNQRMVADSYKDCLWTHNPGPTWGISYNFNWAFRYVYTPWAFLIEDGLRPSRGWLEAALSFVEKIGSRRWEGREVGMAGFSSIQDWTLALAGVWPDKDVMAVYDGDRSAFYGSWNDGLWCWPRLARGIARAVGDDTSHWRGDVAIFRDVVVSGLEEAKKQLPENHWEQVWQKWRVDRHWPQTRTAGVGWYPGAFMLVNVDAWRDVGRFRDGCTFFEGHLGVRMGMKGYLSLVVESPPFLHCPSQGFKEAPLARTPRDHRDTEQVFMEDFGLGHMAAPNVLASGVVSLEEQARVNDLLAHQDIHMVPAWEEWL